jgi:hypothetical protein
MKDHINYLSQSVPALVKGLSADQEPSFGLMSPQHMIEHLIWVTKSTIKDMGPAPDELNEKQLGFMKFVTSESPMVHRPSDKTKADLGELRFDSLAESINELNNAIKRFVSDVESRGDKAYYNPMMGVLTPAQMASFHARHYQYHLEKQFGLSAKAV